MNEQRELMSLSEAPGLYADAVLTDHGGNLLFLSLWGRDTGVQEFLARLSLPLHEGGLDSFHVQSEDRPDNYVQIGNPDRLKKLTGRADHTIFGTLVNLWLYDRLTCEPDKANRRACLLHQPWEDPLLVRDRLWTLVKETCHLPLLDHWREPLLETCDRSGWLSRIEGIGIGAWLVDLDETGVEASLSRMIQTGRLSLDEKVKREARPCQAIA